MTHPDSIPASDEALVAYDAGLLNDHGGGNVEWWQDYIRAQLGRAHDFYAVQFHAREAAAKADAEMLAGALEQSQLGLTVLADMLKRVGLERGEQVAVQMHRDNTAALATYQEKN